MLSKISKVLRKKVQISLKGSVNLHIHSNIPLKLNNSRNRKDPNLNPNNLTLKEQKSLPNTKLSNPLLLDRSTKQNLLGLRPLKMLIVSH